MSMKNSNDTIGNRTRDLPACIAVPFHHQTGFKFKEETSKMPHLCWWRRTETSWTDRVKNEILQSIKEERNVQHAAK